MSRMTWPGAVWVLLLVAAVAACGPGEEEQHAAEEAAEWGALQEEHAALGALRAELNAIRAEIDAGPEGDEATGLSPEEALLNLQKDAEAKEGEVTAAADAFSTNLVGFINKYAGYEGEEQSDVQLAAIRLKSDEDIELAREYVTKGGDYRRALDILGNTALADPSYGRVKDEIERWESLRYMDEERFSKVDKGMTQNEVRSLLGQVFHGNVRDYEERDIIAWFYPKEEGAASAIYFRETRGQLRVYDLDFDAVKTAAERAE